MNTSAPSGSVKVARMVLSSTAVSQSSSENFRITPAPGDPASSPPVDGGDDIYGLHRSAVVERLAVAQGEVVYQPVAADVQLFTIRG